MNICNKYHKHLHIDLYTYRYMSQIYTQTIPIPLDPQYRYTYRLCMISHTITPLVVCVPRLAHSCSDYCPSWWWHARSWRDHCWEDLRGTCGPSPGQSPIENLLCPFSKPVTIKIWIVRGPCARIQLFAWELENCSCPGLHRIGPQGRGRDRE